MADSRRAVSVALYVTLGLIGAFVVSIVAGLGEEQPAGTGLRVLVPGAGNAREVRVEVLNGAGTSGLARDATHRLRSGGFDVVFFGNADHFGHERSVVVDRVGSPARARAVAAALGIDSVVTAIDSALMLEVTVVLGDDWPPAAAPATSWLERLRRLVDPDSAADGEAPGDSTP